MARPVSATCSGVQDRTDIVERNCRGFPQKMLESFIKASKGFCPSPTYVAFYQSPSLLNEVQKRVSFSDLQYLMHSMARLSHCN